METEITINILLLLTLLLPFDPPSVIELPTYGGDPQAEPAEFIITTYGLGQ
jgi:hypothetical protein